MIWQRLFLLCCVPARLSSFFFLLFFMFIHFWERERERERAQAGEGGTEREEDTESEAGSRFRAVSTEPDRGLKPMNCEIMMSRSRMLHRLSHPGTPSPTFCILTRTHSLQLQATSLSLDLEASTSPLICLKFLLLQSHFDSILSNDHFNWSSCPVFL